MNYQQHKCKATPTNDGSISIELNEDNDYWILRVCKLATEEDLEENHYLEVIGETIWQTEIDILHCPFCGEKLSIKKDTSRHDFGHFHHNDFSTWTR